MASSAGEAGGGEGREEMQEEDSLDWMLDSLHVNVGLWNHFDGHEFGAREPGSRDLEETPQQSSWLDRLQPPFQADVDQLRRLDGRFEGQGLGDRGGSQRGSVGTECVDPSDIALNLSGTLNDLGLDAHYRNTSTRSIQHDLPLSSGSTALSISGYHEIPTELSRSVFDESRYNCVGREVPQEDYHYSIHDFRRDGCDTVFSIGDSITPDSFGVTLPESFPLSDYESPFRQGNSSQQAHVLNIVSSDEVHLHARSRYPLIAPAPYDSINSTEGQFICQRCKHPRCFNLEADLQRHTAANHPTRKVWVAVDISSDKMFLANCEACRMGKRYEGYSNAAAHLERVHFTPSRTWQADTYGASSGTPTTEALMSWVQELEEDVNTEQRSSQLAVPEIIVHDYNEGTADLYSDKNDLRQPRHGCRKALSLDIPSLSTDCGQKKECTHQEDGESTIHSRSPKTLDDQLLAPIPRRMASPYESADSGYMSDGIMHSNHLKVRGEESSYWAKSGDNEDSFINDVVPYFCQEESHCHHGKEVKEEPSESPEIAGTDSIGLRETEYKRERKGEYFCMKNELEVVRDEVKRPYPADRDPGRSQQSSESYKLKRKRTDYSPPTLAVASDDVKSESLVDVDLKKDLAKMKSQKIKHDAYTTKAEFESVDAPSVTSAPLISFNMEPSHPKYRKTLPVPFGHPKSKQWTELLPSIKDCTKNIMGKGNGGALELLLMNGEPTICITCWDPLKLDLGLLESCMKPLGLQINVTHGKIEKSAGEQHDWPTIGAMPGQSMFPSVNGHYMQRPTCGASLGTADGLLKYGKVSLGGYVKVKHLYQRHWSYYAMTVHHILVSEDQKESPSISGNQQHEEVAEPGYDYSPGVRNGVYMVGERPGVRVTLSCPAVPDAENLVARLESRRIKRCASESYATIDNLDNLDDLLHKMYTRESIVFGNATWSSGLCFDQDVEMDWLLIGDLPMGRIGCNKPGDIAAYMEGNHQDVVSEGCWTPSTYVDESAFSTLMNFSAQEWGEPGSKGGYLSRVFGRGSETGLADGFLCPQASLFYDETYGTYYAWAFTPRYPYGLGDSGDSGTWIFTSEGKLLGQIIAYNRARHITYYTPMCKIFNHIKQTTGATDIQLLTPEDVTEVHGITPTSASGLLSPEEGPRHPGDCSTSTVTNLQASVVPATARKRSVTPPQTPASSSQPLPSHLNHCSTTGLPTPGSTQASEWSE